LRRFSGGRKSGSVAGSRLSRRGGEYGGWSRCSHTVVGDDPEEATLFVSVAIGEDREDRGVVRPSAGAGRPLNDNRLMRASTSSRNGMESMDPDRSIHMVDA
jgi:hypothetical protein